VNDQTRLTPFYFYYNSKHTLAEPHAKVACHRC
jgi:hypothetical protein